MVQCPEAIFAAGNCQQIIGHCAEDTNLTRHLTSQLDPVDPVLAPEFLQLRMLPVKCRRLLVGAGKCQQLRFPV